jgi:hypothetical protein
MLSEMSNSGHGMDDVAHGTEPHDQQAQHALLLHPQPGAEQFGL